MRKQKILGVERNVFFLGLVSFFNDFSSEMILSIFPAFFRAVLKSGAAALGLVEGIADATSNFIKIFSGVLSDNFQTRKRLALIGYAISVATRPLYLFFGNPGGVTGLRIFDRFGKGVREAPRDALISLAATSQELGKSFGFHKAMDSAGAILGPLVAYLILRNAPQNFNAIFITSFITGLFALATFIFVTEAPRFLAKARLRYPSFKKFNGSFKLFLFASFILSSGSVPVAVMLLRTQDVGFALATIPLFYLIYNLSFTAASYLAGRSADYLGDRRLITTGYLMLLASYALLIIAPSKILLVISFALLGLYSAFTESIQRSHVARITNQEQRGEAFGFLSSALGFGSLIAGIFGGLAWEFLGAPATLSIWSLIVVTGLLVLHAQPDAR